MCLVSERERGGGRKKIKREKICILIVNVKIKAQCTINVYVCIYRSANE